MKTLHDTSTMYFQCHNCTAEQREWSCIELSKTHVAIKLSEQFNVVFLLRNLLSRPTYRQLYKIMFLYQLYYRNITVILW